MSDIWQGRNNEGDIVLSPMNNGLFSYAYTENPTESFEIGAKELCDFFEPKNPKGGNSKEQGRKDDSSKRRYSLLPKGAVNSVVDVLEFGSKKYADNNWQKVPDAKTRYYDAAMRHLDAWFNGDLKDAETGLPHLAHAICCLMFLMWFDSEAADD